MQIQQLWKPVSIFSIMAVLLIGYTNCSQPKVSENIDTTDLGSSASTRLALGPIDKTVNWGANLQLVATGGAPPYYYKLLYGAGTINASTGYYQAPSFDRASVIQVIDSAGAIAQTNVYTLFSASSTLSMSFSSATIQPGNSVTLTASGGTAPYTYWMLSGVGSIAGNVYYAASGGSGVIAVRDSKGVQGTFGVTVSTSITVVSHSVYRHYHGASKLYSYSKSSTPSSGWTVQTSFKLLSNTTYLNTVPLYRCKISDTRGYYMGTSCSAYVNEGELGYIYQYPAANSKPLYACFRSDKGTYMYSLNAQECLDNFYSVQSAVGYVPL